MIGLRSFALHPELLEFSDTIELRYRRNPLRTSIGFSERGSGTCVDRRTVSPRFPLQVAVFKAETPWVNPSVETTSHLELRLLP